MEKMLLFLILALLLACDLSAQPLWLSPDVESYSFMSIYCTGVRINLVQKEGETVEKILERGTTQVIFLRKDHLGLPSVFFTNLNSEATDKKGESATLAATLITEIRKLFREFLLSISLFNFLIEKQVLTNNSQPVNPAIINQTSQNELPGFVSLRQ